MLQSIGIRYFRRLFSGPAKSVTPGRKLTACIFKLDRMGDFVLATGAIRYILREYGPERCLLIVSPAVQDLASHEFSDTRQVSIPVFGCRTCATAFRAWRTIRPLLGEYAFDQLVCLRHQPDLYRDIILSWIHAPQSFGVRRVPWTTCDQDSGAVPYVFSHQVDYPEQPKEGICQELNAHAEVLSQVFKRKIDPAQLLPELRSVKARAGTYLLVSPFASMRIKDVLALPMAAALRKVQGETGLPVRLSGAAGDHVRLKEFRAALLQERIVNVDIVATPSVSLFTAMIAEAGMVLTVDTATAHIAVALDKPAVVLLGGGHYGVFGPWRRSARQRWLTHPMDCFGCNWQCIHRAPYCLRSIPSETVATALIEVWNLRDKALTRGR